MSTFQIVKNGFTYPAVTYLRVRWLNVFAIIVNSRELWQHVLGGDPNVVEPGVAIICSRPCAQGLDTYYWPSINNPFAMRMNRITYLYRQLVYQVTHCGLLQRTIKHLAALDATNENIPSDLNWTRNKWGPMFFPLGRISWACTTPWVENLPAPPIHHLLAVNVGEWISNSLVAGM